MRIAQLLLPGASEYERRSQRIDADALTAIGFELTNECDARVAHVYGPDPLPRLRAPRIPFVANARLRSRWWLRAREPNVVISPLKDASTFVPEAIDDSYFSERPAREPDGRYRLGTFNAQRVGIHRIIDLTLHRLHRFRDDVDWLVFDHAPSLEELGGLDAWVDPASSDTDFDGFVAEGLAAGLAVVATRTPINLQRTEKGRSALLVPHDPNELTHAILAALFKAEVHRPRIDAARQTISKFRAKHRVRALAQIYENLGK
ncbi:MAG: hypothetical protein QOI24_3081 [Acidobacteriota bacterium]|nr:hypothetical protein [Acidobacteriota bacterium]